MPHNTILITGKYNPIDNKVNYDIYIWAAQQGEQLQLIRTQNIETRGYSTLWDLVKYEVGEYFENELFLDGAYTQYLDHLILL